MRKPPEGRVFEKAISKTILSHRQWGRYLSCQKYWKHNWIWRLHCVKNCLNSADTLFGPKGLLCPYIRYGYLALWASKIWWISACSADKNINAYCLFLLQWKKCLKPSTLVSWTASMEGRWVAASMKSIRREILFPSMLVGEWWGPSAACIFQLCTI